LASDAGINKVIIEGYNKTCFNAFEGKEIASFINDAKTLSSPGCLKIVSLFGEKGKLKL
jgi:hypothetical protein